MTMLLLSCARKMFDIECASSVGETVERVERFNKGKARLSIIVAKIGINSI